MGGNCGARTLLLLQEVLLRQVCHSLRGLWSTSACWDILLVSGSNLEICLLQPPTSWVVRQLSGFYQQCLRFFFRLWSVGFIAEQMKPVS